MLEFCQVVQESFYSMCRSKGRHGKTELPVVLVQARHSNRQAKNLKLTASNLMAMVHRWSPT